MLLGVLTALLMLAALTPAPAQTAQTTPAATSARHQAATKPRRQTRRRAQHTPRHADSGISDARALQIQRALVSSGYLDQASGHWDAVSRAAMTRFQKDHHWQTHDVPDARALIALGLGPAMDSVPPTADANNNAPGADPDAPPAGR